MGGRGGEKNQKELALFLQLPLPLRITRASHPLPPNPPTSDVLSWWRWRGKKRDKKCRRAEETGGKKSGSLGKDEETRKRGGHKGGSTVHMRDRPSAYSRRRIDQPKSATTPGVLSASLAFFGAVGALLGVARGESGGGVYTFVNSRRLGGLRRVEDGLLGGRWGWELLRGVGCPRRNTGVPGCLDLAQRTPWRHSTRRQRRRR